MPGLSLGLGLGLNPRKGVPQSIAIEGVSYFLLRDDQTNEILRDDDTNQPLYDLAA